MLKGYIPNLCKESLRMIVSWFAIFFSVFTEG